MTNEGNALTQQCDRIEVPRHLILSEEEVAVLMLGPKRAHEWPARRRLLERKGFPPISKFYGGRYREAIEAFIRQDLLGTWATDVEAAMGDPYLTIVPYAPDTRDETNAAKSISTDRRRRTVR